MALAWKPPGYGEIIRDHNHGLYYRGEKIKKAYYRGNLVWGAEQKKPLDELFLLVDMTYFNSAYIEWYESQGFLIDDYGECTISDFNLMKLNGEIASDMMYPKNYAGANAPHKVRIKIADTETFTRKRSTYFFSPGVEIEVETSIVDVLAEELSTPNNTQLSTRIYNSKLYITLRVNGYSGSYMDHQYWHRSPQNLNRSSNFWLISVLSPLPYSFFSRNVSDGTIYSAFPNLFDGSIRLETVTPALFEDIKKETVTWTSISTLFQSCHSLIDVPSATFDNLCVSDVASCFNHCISLKTLDLSKLNLEKPSVPNRALNGLFGVCASLETVIIPNALFDSSNYYIASVCSLCANLKSEYAENIINALIEYTIPNLSTRMDISNGFAGCLSIDGEIPDIWNKVGNLSVTSTRCFRGCNNASNYASIPSAWK